MNQNQSQVLVVYIGTVHDGGWGGYNMDSRMNEPESEAGMSSIHRYSTLQWVGVGTTWTEK